MDGVKWLFDVSGNWIATTLPPSLLRSLLVDGVWKGVGSVIVFLPQVLLLFLFIGILEDSGYLARAALIADRTMAKVGLQGKSFIPLLSAYACAVPAILATRTIENKRDRIATILIAPFMTCSARLPVYTLIIAAFLPNRQLLGVRQRAGGRPAGTLRLGFPGGGGHGAGAEIVHSEAAGARRFCWRCRPTAGPPLQSIGLRLFDRSKVFLRRAGTVILLVTVVLWVAAHLPTVDGKAPAIEHSLAGTIGHAIEPVIKPLGFNWKIGIGLITSLAARETIIGTLGEIYGMDPRVARPRHAEGPAARSHPGGAVALLVFFAFAMQCISTIAVVRRETGGWRWPLFQFAYMGVLAYARSVPGVPPYPLTGPASASWNIPAKNGRDPGEQPMCIRLRPSSTKPRYRPNPDRPARIAGTRVRPEADWKTRCRTPAPSSAPKPSGRPARRSSSADSTSDATGSGTNSWLGPSPRQPPGLESDVRDGAEGRRRSARGSIRRQLQRVAQIARPVGGLHQAIPRIGADIVAAVENQVVRLSHADRRCGARTDAELIAVLLRQCHERLRIAAVERQQLLGPHHAEIVSGREIALHLLLNGLVQFAVPGRAAAKRTCAAP